MWVRAAICTLVAIGVAAAPARAERDDGPGGPTISRLGFRAAIDKEAKRLKADGIPVDAIGPYRVRGVDVMRFVRRDRAGDWLAIHIWRTGGRTWISVVPRPLDEPRSTE